jgi:DNA-binding response OmpR family regulator
MNVLLVEDEIRIASFMSKGLTAEGFGVRWATTGVDALAIATAAPEYFNVVVLDLGLPDIDGLEVLRILRAEAIDAVVIVVTARDDDTSRQQARDLGAIGYICKPFAFAELLGMVRELPRRDVN